MGKPQDSDKIFTRRSFLIGAGKIGLMGTLIGRMAYLQIFESSKYSRLADSNRIQLRLTPPPRGRILDYRGIELAGHENTYRAVLTIQKKIPPDDHLRLIFNLLSMDEDEQQMIYESLEERPLPKSIVLKENLAWPDISRLEMKHSDMDDVVIESIPGRTYPYGHVMAHVVGYVGQPTIKTNDDKQIYYKLPGLKIGKEGLEKIYDDTLRGIPGKEEWEMNARGQMVRPLSKVPPKPGNDMRTTLDHDLQMFLFERLSREKSVTGVIMDIESGGIRAMASFPAYDPMLFASRISARDWNNLSSDPGTPLINKAISGIYPPGSIFKLITALAALDAGIVDEHTIIHCNGYTMIGNRKCHCWKEGGHGNVNLHDAISKSCNVFFYETARKMGPDALTSMAQRFGLGQKTGIDLPGEKAGIIPFKHWKESKRQKWSMADTAFLGIGQGQITTTPLQLCTMMARLIKGSLVPHVLSNDQTFDMMLDDHHRRLVIDGLIAVINDPGGTGFRQMIDINGKRYAGKSATAQVRRITEQERLSKKFKPEHFEWIHREHGMFAGFGPIDQPTHALSIVVEHGGWGSQSALPIAHDIFEYIFKQSTGQ